MTKNILQLCLYFQNIIFFIFLLNVKNKHNRWLWFEGKGELPIYQETLPMRDAKGFWIYELVWVYGEYITKLDAFNPLPPKCILKIRQWCKEIIIFLFSIIWSFRREELFVLQLHLETKRNIKIGTNKKQDKK